MQSKQGQTIFSATDLVKFLECEHLTALDRINLETPLPRSEDSEEARLFQGKGLAHEAAFRETLQPRVFEAARITEPSRIVVRELVTPL